MGNPKKQNSSSKKEDVRYIEIIGQDGSSKALLVGLRLSLTTMQTN